MVALVLFASLVTLASGSRMGTAMARQNVSQQQRFKESDDPSFEGFVRVEADKWGKIEVSPEEHAFETVSTPDISATEYELVMK